VQMPLGFDILGPQHRALADRRQHAPFRNAETEALRIDLGEARTRIVRQHRQLVVTGQPANRRCKSDSLKQQQNLVL